MSSPSSSFNHSSVSSFIPIVSVANSPSSYISATQTNDHVMTCTSTSAIYSNPAIVANNCSNGGDFQIKQDQQMCSDQQLCPMAYEALLPNAFGSESGPKNIKTFFTDVPESNPKHPILNNVSAVEASDKTSTGICEKNVPLTFEQWMDKTSSYWLNTCPVVHKKKYHYHREIFQQQQKYLLETQQKELHNKEHGKDAYSAELSSKKDVPVIEDIQPIIHVGSSYFENLPLHHENEMAPFQDHRVTKSSALSPVKDQSLLPSTFTPNSGNYSKTQIPSHNLVSSFVNETVKIAAAKTTLIDDVGSNYGILPQESSLDLTSATDACTAVPSIKPTGHSLLSNDYPIDYCQSSTCQVITEPFTGLSGSCLSPHCLSDIGPHRTIHNLHNCVNLTNSIDFSTISIKDEGNIAENNYVQLTRPCDHLLNIADKVNEEGKHITDISCHTVQKHRDPYNIDNCSVPSSVSSDVLGTHNVNSGLGDFYNLQNTNWPLSSKFDIKDVHSSYNTLKSLGAYISKNNYIPSTLSVGLTNASSSAANAAPVYLNACHSLKTDVASRLPGSPRPTFNSDFLQQYQEEKQTYTETVDENRHHKDDRRDLLEPFFLGNSTSVNVPNDDTYLNQAISYNINERNPEVLPNVDDFNTILNLALPQYPSQNVSTDEKIMSTFANTSHSSSYLNQASNTTLSGSMFTSPLNPSLNLSSSALSPVHSSFNPAIYQSPNFEEIVQANFPLYHNIPPFHSTNINFPPPDLPVSTVYPAPGNKSLSTGGNFHGQSSPLSPLSHPINLASDSAVYDPQSSIIPAHSLPAPIPISLALQPFHASHIFNTHSFAMNPMPSCLPSNPILAHSHSLTVFAPQSSLPNMSPSINANIHESIPSEQFTLPPSVSLENKTNNSLVSSSSSSVPTHLLSNILAESVSTASKPKCREESPLQLTQPSSGGGESETRLQGTPVRSPSPDNNCRQDQKKKQEKIIDFIPGPTRLLKFKSSVASRSIKKAKKFKSLVQNSKSSTFPKDYFSCSKCPKEFSSAKLLNKHKFSDHDAGSVECNICKAVFKDRLSLRQHRQSQKQCSRRRYVCCYCNRSFGGSSSLAAHKRIHTGEMPYFCKQCGKKFRHRATLKSHELVHSGERPFQCRICSLRFSQRATLARHSKNHMDPERLRCGVCSSVLKDKDGLAKHMKMLHFACDVCNLSFYNKKKLESHVFKAHEEKSRPFKCDLCSSTFAVKLNYTKHKNSIHRTKDLVCDECGAKFKRMDRFNAHKKIHCQDVAVQVHRCVVCQATFNQRNSLSKHYRAMHNLSPKTHSRADTPKKGVESSAVDPP